MARSHVRRWERFIRGWSLGDPERRMELSDLVQQVILVDDVRAFQLPPIPEMYSSDAELAAQGAGTFTQMSLQATTRPIQIVALFIDGTTLQRYGVVRADPITTVVDTITPTRLSGDPNYTVTAVLRRGHSAANVLSADAPELVVANARMPDFERPILIPGDYFLVENFTANQRESVRIISWIELASAQQVQTSLQPA